MEPADLIMQLKDVFASPSAADVFKTIYLDPLLFRAFEESDAIEKCKTACGTEPENWTVLRIGLALSNVSLSEQDLTQEPLQPLAADLRQKVSTYYQKTSRNPGCVTSVEDAVMLSIALRERRRLTESWSGLSKEITHNFTVSQFNPEDWISAFAMTLEMGVDKDGLQEEISLFSTTLGEMEYFVFLSRILLSKTENTLGEPSPLLVESIRVMDEATRVKALEWLHGYGYDELAQQISHQFISGGEKGKNQTEIELSDPLDVSNQLDLINKLALEQKIRSFASDPAAQSTYLLQQEALLRQAQARIEAQRAANITGEARIQIGRAS